MSSGRRRRFTCATMKREEEYSKAAFCKKVCCWLGTMLVGLVCCCIIIALAYSTYQAAVGNVDFCSLWTDIPGRLAIFFTCFYVSGMCGYFPIPQRVRLNFFPEPFTLWRLESWKNMLNNFHFPPLPSCLMNRIRRRRPDELPLLADKERFYDSFSSPRRRSDPIGIAYPDSYVTYRLPEANKSPRNKNIDANTGADDSSSSFDSPNISGIDPKLERHPRRRRHHSDCSSELTKKDLGCEQVERPRNHPRFPWAFFRNPEGIPKVAKKIERRNLRDEAGEYVDSIRRQTEESKRVQAKRRLALGDLLATADGKRKFTTDWLYRKLKEIATGKSEASTENRVERGLSCENVNQATTGRSEPSTEVRDENGEVTSRTFIDPADRWQIQLEIAKVTMPKDGASPAESPNSVRKPLPIVNPPGMHKNRDTQKGDSRGGARFKVEPVACPSYLSDNRLEMPDNFSGTSRRIRPDKSDFSDCRLEIYKNVSADSSSVINPTGSLEYGHEAQKKDSGGSRHKTEPGVATQSTSGYRKKCEKAKTEQGKHRLKEDLAKPAFKISKDKLNYSSIPQADSDVLEPRRIIPVEKGIQTTSTDERESTADRNPTRSTQAEMAEKPDTEIPVSFLKDDSKDNSDFKPGNTGK